VTAHNRKMFLRAAVESVLAQTAPRRSYEIIVVKNFSDAHLDTYFAQQGVRMVYTNLRPLGAKVAEGLKASSGKIVCFLEDDDLFAMDKLERIGRLFTQYGDASMTRNSVKYMDAAGRVIGEEEHKLEEPVIIRDPDKSLDSFQRLGPHKNLSSICVRREVALKMVDHYYRIGAADLFTFCVASQSGCVLVTPAKLTYYRVHSASATSLITKSYDGFMTQDIFTEQILDRGYMLSVFGVNPPKDCFAACSAGT
jgi:glycosyltransferase involved in cell wall biosynthesis